MFRLELTAKITSSEMEIRFFLFVFKISQITTTQSEQQMFNKP